MVPNDPFGLRKQVGESSQISLDDKVPATCFLGASALEANRDHAKQINHKDDQETASSRISI